MSTKLITKIREMTGAGITDCRDALRESGNDIDRACRWLREKGIAATVKKSVRTAKQGLVYSYIHSNGMLGVLLEVNCETDFVAKTKDFHNLIKEIAMQIAASAPAYVSREQVPISILESEREIYRIQLEKEGKPENIRDKIIEGKIEKFYSQVCLFDQVYIRDSSGKETVKDLIAGTVMKLGENIVVKRFARFKLGEE